MYSANPTNVLQILEPNYKIQNTKHSMHHWFSNNIDNKKQSETLIFGICCIHKMHGNAAEIDFVNS